VAAIERLRSDAMKGSTVDLVVTGDENAAVAAAVDAVSAAAVCSLSYVLPVGE
jgi:hypothetical protein